MAGVPPPGPRGHWLLGSLPDLTRDMPRALLDLTRGYGPVVRLRVGPTELYLVGDGDLIVEMISRRAGELRSSSRTRQPLGGHLGAGLVTLDGVEHRRHRRLVQPAMHASGVAAHTGIMVALANERTASWSDGSTPDIAREMQDLTLRMMTAALFGVADQELVAAVRAFAGPLTATVRRPFPFAARVPTTGNRWRRAGVRRLRAVVSDLIAKRRTDPGKDDLLSLLLGVTDGAGGAPLSDVEIRDELLTMFFAGHETTAAALTWALYLLARHPDVADEVRAELVDAGTDEPRLLVGVVKETLRLYPPVWVLDRSPRLDVTIGGYAVPRDANLLFSPWVAHRDPSRWPAADEFRPQRWMTDWVPSRGAYLPFGDGPRMCVGDRFAEAGIQAVLATILPRVQLSLVDDSPVRPAGGATLRPRGGLPMRVRQLG